MISPQENGSLVGWGLRFWFGAAWVPRCPKILGLFCHEGGFTS